MNNTRILSICFAFVFFFHFFSFAQVTLQNTEDANYIKSTFIEGKGIEVRIFEIDNDITKLILERSSDGFKFEQIKTWNIEQGLFDPNGYLHVDENHFIGYNYYKVYAFSPDDGIVRIHSSVSRAYRAPEEILIFPNPSIDRVKVSLFKGVESRADITLTDASGKVLIQQEGVEIGEHWYFEIDVSEYKAGLYFLRAIGDIETIILKPTKLYIYRPN